MPTKNQPEKDQEFTPYSPDENTTISVSQNKPVSFVLNTSLGREDLNENFRKIQEAINELKEK